MWADKKTNKTFVPGLQIESYCVWYQICIVRFKKTATLQGIRKKFTYEMDKINSQNYIKCSKKVMKMCLEMCGKAIHIPGLYEGRVDNRRKNNVFFRVKTSFLENFMQKSSTKKFHDAKIVLHCD